MKLVSVPATGRVTLPIETIRRKAAKRIAAAEDAQLVGGGRDRARVEAAGIGVGRRVHPERAGRFVHRVDEGRFAPGHPRRQHAGDVVAGGDQQRLQQLALGQPLARLDRDDRLALFGFLGDRPAPGPR